MSRYKKAVTNKTKKKYKTTKITHLILLICETYAIYATYWQFHLGPFRYYFCFIFLFFSIIILVFFYSYFKDCGGIKNILLPMPKYEQFKENAEFSEFLPSFKETKEKVSKQTMFTLN